MKRLALAALIASTLSASHPIREINIGEDVGWAGRNAGNRSPAAMTIDSDGVVTVRLGATFPEFYDDSGKYLVRIRSVKVVR